MARHALVCSYYAPTPDRDSGSRRLAHLLEFLREEGWRVSFWASNGLSDVESAHRLRQSGMVIHDGTTESLSELVTALPFDLAIFAFWPIAEYLMPMLRRHSPATHIIVDSLDLHFLRDARRVFNVSARQNDIPLLSEDYGSQIVGELNSYAAADGVLTVSEKEAEIVNDYLNAHSMAHAVPDCEEFEIEDSPLERRRGILSLGSYQHPPNLQALEFLCNNILPRVGESDLEKHPLYVVGSGLDEKACRAARKVKHARIVGWAPSVEPYFAAARISVVPLLYGAGTKRKMIQSMMSGVPTVTTSIGAEGLDIEHGRHAMICDHPQEFAEAITALLHDDGLWSRISKSARDHVMSQHSRKAARARFLQAIEHTTRHAPKPAILKDCTLEKHQTRINYQYYQQVSAGIKEAIYSVIPPGATLLVATEGINELLRLRDRTARHFPQADDGSWQRGSFADIQAFVDHIDEMASAGAEYLVLPTKMVGQYTKLFPAIRDELSNRYSILIDDQSVCLIARLNGGLSGTRVETIEDDAASCKLFEAQPPAVKLIAFYLPQYHPIPENDQWWGDGFTDWRNVAKATPLFPGHNQPQLPSELGFCDLRVAETRQAQAELAQAHGIHGFCYYHYWFAGKRLLERPLNEVLETGEPKLPFCLCWANEPWSRRWDGSENSILQPQSYSAEDDLAHIQWLLKPLTDPRAITVDDKPVFIVYKGKDLPDPQRTTDLWRREAERAGLKGLYLMAVETGWDAGWDATQVGFDAKIGFQPQFSDLSNVPRLQVGPSSLHVYDYAKAWRTLANPEPVSYLRYETVFPSWDNTARRGEHGWVLHKSTPELYGRWLEHAMDRAMSRPVSQRIVFVNAWNEWAEGCHLEPDRRHGRAYLHVTRRAVLARCKSES